MPGGGVYARRWTLVRRQEVREYGPTFRVRLEVQPTSLG